MNLRPIDRKPIEQAWELHQDVPIKDDIWFIHTILAQCFLPYCDPKKDTRHRKDGDFSIFLNSGVLEDLLYKKSSEMPNSSNVN